MTDPDWTPARVRALRDRLAVSQTELARRVPCHRNAVVWWESGRRTPTGLYAAALDRLERDAPQREPAATDAGR